MFGYLRDVLKIDVHFFFFFFSTLLKNFWKAVRVCWFYFKDRSWSLNPAVHHLVRIWAESFFNWHVRASFHSEENDAEMKVEVVQGKVQSKTRFMRIHWDQDGKCKFGTRCTFRQSSELTPTTWTPQNSWKGQSCEKETVCQHQCKPAAALAGNGWYSWTRMSGKCRWRGPWQDFHAMTCDHTRITFPVQLFLLTMLSLSRLPTHTLSIDSSLEPLTGTLIHPHRQYHRPATTAWVVMTVQVTALQFSATVRIFLN